MPTVKTIPATVKRYTSTPITDRRKRKVAAYARVSTDSDEQATSYEAQIDYYTNYIKGRDDWEFAGMYADEGITGTSTMHREGFKRMVNDALAGKIDLIITKSVSRFARNTVDSLTTIRQLKEHGTECYFEKENIWTFDNKGELLITIMSSLAQEESRSISENVIWGHRKRMADGRVLVPFGVFLGYKRGPNGEMVVDEEQAVVVRNIYAWFLQGLSPNAIAARLTQMGVPTPGGKETWYPSSVKAILVNEKYKGDALMQKYYTEDFLTKKLVPNNGELPQYYVEGDHEAIIPPETFELVQRELERRKQKRKAYSGLSPFASRIICGECGGFYGAKVWHSNEPKYRKVVYRCDAKYRKSSGKDGWKDSQSGKDGESGKRCSTPYVSEEQIKAGFVIAMNKLIAGKEEILTLLKGTAEQLFETAELETERDQLADELAAVAGEMEDAVYENARRPMNQAEYEKRYNALTDHYNDIKAKHDAIVERISKLISGRAATKQFIATLGSQDEPIEEFDAELWGNMIDHVTVYTKEDLRYTFRDGTEIKIAGEERAS